VTITVLVAEDSVTMRRVIEMCFTGEAARVISYASAKAALQHAIDETPHVVIADTSLPEMNGYELAAALREQPSTEQVPVILLTSAEHPFDELRANTAGVQEHVRKPFESQDLLRIVAHAIHHSEASTTQVPSLDRGDWSTTGATERPTPPEMTPSPAPAAVDPAPSSALSSRPPPPPVFDHEERASSAPATRPPPPPVFDHEDPAAAPPPFPATPPTLPVGPAGAVEMLASLLPPSESLAISSQMHSRMNELGLSDQQLTAVVAVAREAVEQVVWEVVPRLAETIIREEIARLTAE